MHLPFSLPAGTLLLRPSLLCEVRGFDEALFIGEGHEPGLSLEYSKPNFVLSPSR
jgi:hypothetical protein